MIRNFFTLVRVEWIKTMRMRTTYIAFVAVVVLVLMIHIGMYFGHSESRIYKAVKEMKVDTSLVVNSFVGTRIGMEFGLLLLIAPMVIQTFARQIAGEDLKGTLRLILSRPISRMALLNAKFVVCGVYALLLMTLFIGLSYGIGLGLYGPKDTIAVGDWSELEEGNINFNPENLPEAAQFKRRHEEIDNSSEPADVKKLMHALASREENKVIERARAKAMIQKYTISNSAAAKRLALSILMTSWSLMTVGALAFFFSVINKHPIAAMGATIGAYFLVFILQQLSAEQNAFPLFKSMHPYLFTHAMEYWRGCLSHDIDWARIRKDAAILGGYTLTLYGVTQFIFWRKDITS